MNYYTLFFYTRTVIYELFYMNYCTEIYLHWQLDWNFMHELLYMDYCTETILHQRLDMKYYAWTFVNELL